jgi:hypothetical protein
MNEEERSQIGSKFATVKSKLGKRNFSSKLSQVGTKLAQKPPNSCF